MGGKVFIDKISVSFMSKVGKFERAFSMIHEADDFLRKTFKRDAIVLPELFDVEITVTWEDDQSLTFFAVEELEYEKYSKLDYDLGDILVIWANRNYGLGRYTYSSSKTTANDSLKFYKMVVNGYEPFHVTRQEPTIENYEGYLETYNSLKKSVDENEKRLLGLKDIDSVESSLLSDMSTMSMDAIKRSPYSGFVRYGLGKKPIAMTRLGKVVGVILSPEMYKKLLSEPEA